MAWRWPRPLADAREPGAAGAASCWSARRRRCPGRGPAALAGSGDRWSAARIATPRPAAPIPARSAAEMLRDAGCQPRHRRPFRAPRTATARAMRWCAPRPRRRWRAGLLPIVCIGETAGRARGGQDARVVLDGQLEGIAAGAARRRRQLVVAYEPVWAIGTGRTPTTAEIAAAHAISASALAELMADGGGGRASSMAARSRPSNAAEMLAVGRRRRRAGRRRQPRSRRISGLSRRLPVAAEAGLRRDRPLGARIPIGRGPNGRGPELLHD